MNKTTIELTALLRQLSTVSPNECRYQQIDGEWQILDTETGHWLHLYDANEIDPFRVAGLVQRRVEARGWAWSIDCMHITVIVFSGVVYHDGTYRKGQSEDTPAAAILSAYIAALEVLNHAR